MPELSVGFVLLVASATIFGPLSGWLAAQRRRNPVLWALFGVALGPVAAGLLLSAPPGRCAACRWPVAGWGTRCVACGADVRTGASGAPIGGLVQPSADLGSAPASLPAAAAAPSRSDSRRSGSAAAGGRRTSATEATKSASRATAGGRRGTRAGATDLSSARLSSGAFPTEATSPAPAELSDVADAAPTALSGTPAVPPPAPTPTLTPVEAPWSPRARATGLGHRPTTTAPRHLSAVPADPDSDAAGATHIVGSAVYMGGNRPIETGNRYLLARVGDELQILGPVHLDAGRVADRLPVGDIEVFLLDGRLLIGSRDARKDVTMAFVAVSLDRGVDLEATFGAPTHPASTSARG